MSRAVSAAVLATVLTVCVPPATAAHHPWMARRPPAPPPGAHQLNDIKRWPAEPVTPTGIDPARFQAAVVHLCGTVPIGNDKPAEQTDRPADGLTLGDLVLAAAIESDVDPFLLAGLMYEQSGCKPGLTSPLGRGLLRIHPDLYRSEGAPKPPGDRDAWRPDALLDPAENLLLGAKLLRMWQDTHADLDVAFGGVPHRGPAAHFIWGDVVRGSGGEDQALTARRRLVLFYQQTPEATTTPASLGITLISPLEGAPRVASSGPGEDRAGGRRRHGGIDLAAALGEPVRAVADGTVIFAGANIPGAPRESIPPSKIARYRWRHLGAGGIYVCIEHAPDRHVVTCYMHLNIYGVSERESVTAGEVIGRVGRTGVQFSPPHLHFELRIDDRHVDPTRYLGQLVIPPKATLTYRLVMQAKRLRVAKTPGAKTGVTTGVTTGAQKL